MGVLVVLCNPFGVGEYRKNGRSITAPVVTVSDNTAQAPVDGEKPSVEKNAKGHYVLSKRTGWLMSSLVLTVLGGAVYVGSSFFTRGHQVFRLQEQVRHLNKELEKREAGRQDLERRVVELETQVEFMHEAAPGED